VLFQSPGDRDKLKVFVQVAAVLLLLSELAWVFDELHAAANCSTGGSGAELLLSNASAGSAVLCKMSAVLIKTAPAHGAKVMWLMGCNWHGWSESAVQPCRAQV
jgi:hypothetical protein